MNSSRMVRSLSAAIALSCAIGYVTQVHAAAFEGYALRDAQERNDALIEEIDGLTGEIDRLRSLASVEQRQVFLGLVPAPRVEYLLPPSAPEVALQR